MRSAWWVALLWVAAISFCCPSLFGMTGSYYYSAAYVCVVDWRPQQAYVLTSAVLIIVLPLVTLAVSNLYMFTADYRGERAAIGELRPHQHLLVQVLHRFPHQHRTGVHLAAHLLQLTEAFYMANLPPTLVAVPPPAFDVLRQWMHFYLVCTKSIILYSSFVISPRSVGLYTCITMLLLSPTIFKAFF